MITRRVALGGLAAFAATGLQVAAQNDGLADLSVGIVSDTTLEWHIYVALKRNFFRDEGLNVTILKGAGGTNTINLLATGSVQIATDSATDLMAAIVHGLPIQMIGPSFETNAYTLVTPPSINGWSDLKGKTIALGPKLNAPGITFNRMAQAHHMSFDDFVIVTTASTALRYAALMSGHVAATVLSQPFDILAEEHGMRVLAEARDYFKSWVFECIAANKNWLAANRPIAVRFLRAIREAIRYAYAHRDETVAVLTTSMKIDPEIAAKAYDVDFRRWRAWDPDLRYNEAGLKAVAEAAIESGAIKEMPKFSSLYDPSIAADAVR
jgi:NitT/TauT family transport system substrate-binding protein